MSEGATVVCRCEQVSAETIIAAARDGASAAQELKDSLRCGAGPCQGRWCALPTNELIGRERGVHPRDTGMLRAGFPLIDA